MSNSKTNSRWRAVSVKQDDLRKTIVMLREISPPFFKEKVNNSHTVDLALRVLRREISESFETGKDFDFEFGE